MSEQKNNKEKNNEVYNNKNIIRNIGSATLVGFATKVQMAMADDYEDCSSCSGDCVGCDTDCFGGCDGCAGSAELSGLES